MNRVLAIAPIFVLCTAVGVSAAERIGVYLTAAVPDHVGRSADGFVDPAPAANAAIQDSVMDIARAFNKEFGWGDMKLVTKREKAKIFMQVVGREEANGTYVVHATATYGDHTFNMTGTSTHQWKQSAAQIAQQLQDWIKANRDKIR